MILASAEYNGPCADGACLAVVVGLSVSELAKLATGGEAIEGDLAAVAGGRWRTLAGFVRLTGSASVAQESATLTSAVVSRGLTLTLCVIVPHVARVLGGEVLIVSQPERVMVRKLAICRASRLEELAAALQVSAFPGASLVAVWLGDDLATPEIVGG